MKFAIITLALLLSFGVGCCENRTLTEEQFTALSAGNGNAAKNLYEQKGVTVSGTMGATTGLFTGAAQVSRLEMAPFDLVITWPAPVTLNCNRIRWDSKDFYATYYGLEYWDEAAQCYQLAYEEPANTRGTSIHLFTPITTTKVRFTVFQHPQQYMALIVKQFQLFDLAEVGNAQ